MRSWAVKRAALLGAVVVAVGVWGAAPAGAADGRVIRDWNDLAFAAVRANNASDAQAARLYAMVDAAMYDAVNATGGRPGREAAIVATNNHAAGDPSAAAAGAAHDLLTALFPAQRGTYDAQLESDLAAVPSRPQAERGRNYGAKVATQVLAARTGDGSSPNESQPGDLAIGKFQDPWTGVQFRNLAPFAIADPGVYVGSGPPPLDSPAYAAAFKVVKELGSDTPADADKRATYDFWALGGKTNQPPGAWLQIGAEVSADRHLPLAETARLFALESMAMADTVAPTYTTKVVYHSWRPKRAIREAGGDGNAQTDPDTDWNPRGGTPGGTPENWSGHSSFSSAGAAVLAGFFCEDHVPFSLTTDPTNGIPTGTRSYDSFSSAAAEAGLSRILGGLHFPFSNEQGADAGRAVAGEVLQTALLREHGPTHDGSCPR
jgi:hypothetical protein